MAIYYLTLVSSYISGFLSHLSDKKKYRVMSIFWIFLLTVMLILFAGLRTGIGDTSMYKHTYELMVQNSYNIKVNGDLGFAYLNLLLTKISSNPQTIVFFVAMVTQAAIIFVFYKYRSAMELQVFMYITAGYFTVTMNGMRQCLAASLIFLCTPLIIKGNFKKYLICILMISTIHQSALLMIPVYFVVRMEPWSLKFYLIAAVSVGCIAFYNVISPYIFKVLESTHYGQYSEFKEGGSSVIRLVVDMVPLILAFLKRDKIKEMWPQSGIFINMSLLNCIFVGIGTANWIFNRVTIYLQLYNFILLPFIIETVLKDKEKRLVYFMFICCYLFFFYWEQVVTLKMKYEFVIDINNLLYYVK